MKHLLPVLCLVLLLAVQVSARPLYVKPDGTGDAPTIQNGIEIASPDAAGFLRIPSHGCAGAPQPAAWAGRYSLTSAPSCCMLVLMLNVVGRAASCFG